MKWNKGTTPPHSQLVVAMQQDVASKELLPVVARFVGSEWQTPDGFGKPDGIDIIGWCDLPFWHGNIILSE